MDYIKGGDLFDRVVQKHVYSEHDARELVFTLASALKYIHSLHIVHRDVKPENILMTSATDDSDIKLTDFGFATFTYGNDLTEQLGTANYLAPELLLRQPYGQSVDIWALGVILFILLSGVFPFHEDDTRKLYRQIATCNYEFDPKYWSTISDESKDLITHILCLNPAERYSLDQILAHPWMNIPEKELSTRSLESSLSRIAALIAHRKLKAAMIAVRTSIFFGSLSSSHSKMERMAEGEEKSEKSTSPNGRKAQLAESDIIVEV